MRNIAIYCNTVHSAVSVAVRSTALVCGRSPAEIVRSNSAGGIDVPCECCLFSDRSPSDKLITREEESYRLWCDVVCDLKTSRIRLLFTMGHNATRGQNITHFVGYCIINFQLI